MLQKLIEFFQNLFGGSTNTNPNPTTPPNPIVTPPTVDDNTLPTFEDEDEDASLVGDGSDLLSDPDSIGTIVFPEELEIEEIEFIPPPITPVEVISDLPTIDPIVDEPEEVVDVPEPITPPAEPVEPVVPVEPVEPVVPEEPKHEAKFMWCLDNGHGKFTAGKRSPKFEDGSQFLEYEFNRDIVKRVIDQLKEKGVKYYNVVPEVETDNFLKGRVDRANAHQSDLPKLYISIHSNAARAESSKHWAVPGAKGMETWYYTGSSRGRKLASIFQKHMVNYTGMVNRGLKSTKKLYVIKNTKMTACLTENGFYNHKEEAQELMKSEVRQSIADAHVAAIMEIEKNGL